MTAYTKIAISLPLRAAEHARRAVREGKAESVSGYVAKAIEHYANGDSLRKQIDEMLAETGGPPTPAERRWVQRQLGTGPTGRRQSGRTPRKRRR